MITPKRTLGQWAHAVGVALMAVVVIAATVDGFAQSWAGLYGWAVEHGLSGWKAMSFPLLVDAFIVVGELGLFLLAIEGHRMKGGGALAWADLVLPGGAAVVGWSVSLAFNVGHVEAELSHQLTAAVAPVASMLGLLILLRTLHRLVSRARPRVAETRARRTDFEEETPRVSLLKAPKISHPETGSATDGHAGQHVVKDIRAAVVSARAAGLSVRAISEAFDLTRYRVDKLLAEPEDEVLELASASPASPNGKVDH